MQEHLKREEVESFSGDGDFSRWRTFQDHAELAGELPACYELAVGRTPTKLDAVVYAGATLEEQQRGKDYARGGSHKKELFEQAKAAGLNIYIRTRKFASRQDAFLFERRMLKSFDYAWNKKDQANPNVRSLEKVLGNTGYKKKYVELHKPTKEDIEEVARENDGRRNADQKQNYEKRLENAVADERSLDRLKPRFLVFKTGKEYNASKPLREQLDMRNKLNKLYVARMEKVAPEKLGPRTESADYGNKPRDDDDDKATAAVAAALAAGPAKKDGKTPDMRYKANKEAAKKQQSAEMRHKVEELQKKDNVTNRTPPTAAAGPVKKDNTPDMRYKANRAASSASASSGSRPGPLKKDNTPDMRYAANRAAAAAPVRQSGPMKSDGTPDMRYAANRPSPSYSSSYGGGGGGGPLTKSGRPDMRYKANR